MANNCNGCRHWDGSHRNHAGNCLQRGISHGPGHTTIHPKTFWWETCRQFDKKPGTEPLQLDGGEHGK